MTKRKSPEIFTDYELLQLWKDPKGLLNYITKSPAAKAKFGRSFTQRDIVEKAKKYIPAGKNLITEGMLYNMSTRYNAVKDGRIKASEPLPGGVRERIVQILFLFANNTQTQIDGTDKFLIEYQKGKYASLLTEADYFAEDLIDFDPVDKKTSERLNELFELLKDTREQTKFLVEQEKERTHYQDMILKLIDEVEEIVEETDEKQIKSKLRAAIQDFRQNFKKII